MKDERDGFRLQPGELRKLEERLCAGAAMTRVEMRRLQAHVAARWRRYAVGCLRRHALLPHEVDDGAELVLHGVLWNIQRRQPSTLAAIAKSGVEGADFRRQLARIASNKAIDVIRSRPDDPAQPVDPTGSDGRPTPPHETGVLSPHDEPNLLEETIGEALADGTLTPHQAEILRDRAAGLELYEIALANGMADKSTKVSTARADVSKAIKAAVEALIAREARKRDHS